MEDCGMVIDNEENRKGEKGFSTKIASSEEQFSVASSKMAPILGKGEGIWYGWCTVVI